MPSIRLTQRRVDALRPRRKVRDVRDAELMGYSVRVMPSGARRYFIHSQHRGKRVWKIIGDAAAIAEPEARARARSMLAALRDGREPDTADPGRNLFETVAEEVFDRYGRRWKPRTLDVNRVYLRRQITALLRGQAHRRDNPGGRAGLVPRALHATPAAANRSAPILSVIMQQAEVWGYRPEDSNPCAGIRRYRQGRSERFLTPGEYRRLSAVLGRHEASRPLHVAAVRLLLLTGCRKSEILTLQWRSYREGRLYLPDSKTGPRTVWLCEAARDVLDSLPRSSGCVFPVAGLRSPWHVAGLLLAWREGGSQAAGCPPARHQALTRQHGAALRREACAPSAAFLVTRSASTTLKYAHLSDATVREAVETLSPVLSGNQASEGAEGPADRRGRRQAEAGHDGIRGLGQRGARPRREGTPVRASQLRLARARPGRAGQGDRRPGRAHDRRARPEAKLWRSAWEPPRTRRKDVPELPCSATLSLTSGGRLYRRRCAPSSCQSTNLVLERQLLPAFGLLSLDTIRRDRRRALVRRLQPAPLRAEPTRRSGSSARS